MSKFDMWVQQNITEVFGKYIPNSECSINETTSIAVSSKTGKFDTFRQILGELSEERLYR